MKEERKRYKKEESIKGLLISDTHIGTRKGATPKMAFDEYTNTFQRWSLEWWMKDVVPNYKDLEYLILVGDVLDGPGSKDSIDLITSDVHKQAEFAKEWFSPIINKKTKVHVLGGSGYHTGKGTGFNSDYLVAEKLNGAYHPERCVLPFPEYDELFYIYHTSKNIKTERSNLYENAYKQKEWKRPSRIFGGHIHKFEESSDGYTKIYHLPCVEYLTPYMKGMARLPDIGFIEFKTDGDKMDVRERIISIPQEVFDEMDHWITKLPRIHESINKEKKDYKTDRMNGKI